MSKLQKNLDEWRSLGLISEDQAKRIHEHEAAKPENAWVLSGLLILGAVIVGIGVISLIAANWDRIPDALKLSADFALLAMLAFATVKSRELKKTMLFEVLLLLFLILCLASIGLISQVYHVGGRLYQALMLWSLITFAATLAARHLFVPLLWAAGFLVGIVFTAMDSLALQPLFHQNYRAILMATPLLFASLTFASQKWAGEIAPTRAFRYWIFISGLMALAAAEFHGFSIDNVYGAQSAYFPGYVLAVFVAWGIWRNRDYRPVQKIVLFLALGIFLALFHLPLLGVKAAVAYATLTILVLGLIAVFLASLKERRFFQVFLFLLGVRFLILYFQALGGLATTGVGLIVSGGMIIGMAVLWNKYRVALAIWTERWTQ